MSPILDASAMHSLLQAACMERVAPPKTCLVAYIRYDTQICAGVSAFSTSTINIPVGAALHVDQAGWQNQI